MRDQIFQLNIPQDLTRSHKTNLYVLVKAVRFEDGRLWKTFFVDVETDLMIEVTNWFALLSIATDQAEISWSEKIADEQRRSKVIPICDLKVTADHAVQLNTTALS